MLSWIATDDVCNGSPAAAMTVATLLLVHECHRFGVVLALLRSGKVLGAFFSLSDAVIRSHLTLNLQLNKHTLLLCQFGSARHRFQVQALAAVSSPVARVERCAP